MRAWCPRSASFALPGFQDLLVNLFIAPCFYDWSRWSLNYFLTWRRATPSRIYPIHVSRTGRPDPDPGHIADHEHVTYRVAVEAASVHQLTSLELANDLEPVRRWPLKFLLLEEPHLSSVCLLIFCRLFLPRWRNLWQWF